METQAQHYETKRIDHLGIVAGVCERIKLIEMIDGMLPSPQERKVSCGQATQAMVLNALGLSGRALYLMPEYMVNKPVELLIGEGLQASDFNDDTLGRALDDLQQAGVTEIFARLAAGAVQEYDITSDYVHLDSSSFTLHGAYDSAYAERMSKTYEAVEVRQGYSKDQRPDLKQVVVNLVTSQASALPLWLEALDGNSSDKTSFQETVTAYCKQMADSERTTRFVFDSAGYSADNLQTWQQVEWVTRVPQTLKQAKELLSAVATEELTALETGYKGCAVCTWYADVPQRWLLVYSEAAFAREMKQLRRRIVKQQPEAEKQWRKLCRTPFHCEQDAMTALTTFASQLAWWQPQAQIVALNKYDQPGRPARQATPSAVHWHIEGDLHLDETRIADHAQQLGRFILATNVLDETALSDAELLACYKQQSSSVERGFRFLKDPMFFADSLFLKSPVRIMAMVMLMGLALLIYSLAERELRLALQHHDETLPDQTGKPTQRITMRRVAQIFEGVDLLIIRVGSDIVARQVLNLTPLRMKILRLFHPSIQNTYLMNI